MKKEYVNVDFADEDHIWVKGRQYVSLKRLAEVKNESVQELRNYEAKVKEITEINEALTKASISILTAGYDIKLVNTDTRKE